MNFWQHHKEYCPLAKFLERHWQGKAKTLDRERDLIELARTIVNKEGFNALTMEKMATNCPFSKGTLYNHFANREDLISALAIYGLSTIVELIEKAADFTGHSREKALAIHYAYQLYSKLEPTLFSSIITSITPEVKNRTSDWRLQGIQELDQRIANITLGIKQQAIRSGDLPHSAQPHVYPMLFANWAMTFGTIVLLNSAIDSHAITREHQQQTLLTNINWLMDGMQWRQLSTEFDYQQTWLSVEQQIFSAETSQLTIQRGNQ